jgi:hypothetical protein
MADNFKRLKDKINKALQAYFDGSDDEEDDAVLLNETSLGFSRRERKLGDKSVLNIVTTLITEYQNKLRKDLTNITTKYKYFRPNIKKLPKNATPEERAKAKVDFYASYRKKLLDELYLQYPEIRSKIKEGKPTENSFSLPGVSKNLKTYLESYLSSDVQRELKLRGIRLPSLGQEEVLIACNHFGSIGFRNASETQFKSFDLEEHSSVVSSTSPKDPEEEKSLNLGLSFSNNDPGNWRITSGAFSGKTIKQVEAYMNRESLDSLWDKLQVVGKAVTASSAQIEQLKNEVVDKYNKSVKKSKTYDKIAASKRIRSSLSSLIAEIKRKELQLQRFDKRRIDISLKIKTESSRINPIATRAMNWILDTHQAILANPDIFQSTFNKVLSHKQKGLSKVFAAVFNAYAEKTNLVETALAMQGLLAKDEERETNPYYTTNQFYVDRGGITRQKEITRYNRPRKNEGGGSSSLDAYSDNTFDPELNPKDQAGMYASKRIYNKNKTRTVDKEDSQRRRDEDFGLTGRFSMLKGLVHGMSVEDKVKFNKLKDVLRTLPKKTTKEWIVDPLTGEQRLMRKGSKMGLMMTYNKHGKLVWREFDVYGKARKSLGGSLEHLRQKEIDKQKILLHAAESMLEQDQLKDSKATGNIALLGEAEEQGIHVAKNKVKGISLVDKNNEELQKEIEKWAMRSDEDYGRVLEQTRTSYTDIIKKAKTHKRLDAVESKIYEHMGKNFRIDDPELRKQVLIVNQIEKFRQDGDLLPDFYTGPTITLDIMKTMREYGSPASIKAIKEFHEAQREHYSEGGRGRQETGFFHPTETDANGNKRFLTEYEAVDYRLPVATQIAIRKMELNNAGTKG